MFFPKREVFEAPTKRELILTTPLQFLITTLYKFTSFLRSSPRAEEPSVRIVCISDTHTHTCEIPDGDVLIHAGDLTNDGNIAELQEQIDWLCSLPHRYKVVIAGNHDTFLDPRSRATLPESDQRGSLDWGGMHYLQHSSVSLKFHGRSLKLYGAPQIPKCGGSNFAFQYDREQDAWTDTIPADTDVLITHSPPKYHRDLFSPSLGCELLLREVWRVRPKLHVFGHIHAGAGRETLWWDQLQSTYEAALARKSKGFLAQVFNVRLWLDTVKVVLYGCSSVVWDRIWGGEQKRTTVINAALMYNHTDVLGNAVQVVDI